MQKFPQNNFMKRNLTLFTAAMLALALFFALCTGKLYAKSVGSFAEEKRVYLTFDDGPSDRVTPLVLDVLKEENVPATFFVVGSQAVSRPYLLKRIVEEGHSIAIHCYDHTYRTIYGSRDALLSDIRRCQSLIASVTGISPSLYRFPGGSFHVREELKQAVKDAGYKAVDWNASCRDEEIRSATPEQLFDAAKATSYDRNRIVLLCHDSTNHTNTAKALPQIIAYYRSRGYAFGKL